MAKSAFAVSVAAVVLALLPARAENDAPKIKFTLPSSTDVAAAPSSVPSTLRRPQPESTRRMVERLAKLEDSANPVGNPYFSAKAATYYRDKMAATTDEHEKADLGMPCAVALLNDGQFEAALQEIENLERRIDQLGLTPRPEDITKIEMLKAVTYLRLGEAKNCLANHNADSCLLPIQGGGIHTDQTGSRNAIRVLQGVLDHDPSPFAVWLYNIAYMTVGGYPQDVPPRWLIPPKVFQSDYDIKRFPDVAGQLGLDVDDISGGVVMDDFDNDGLLDLMVSASGFHSQIHYFHNNGDGTFTDRTDEAGLTGLTGGLNLIQCDYNNDGFIDVLVLRGGWLGKDGRWPASLLRNNGDGTFTDVTEQAGLLTLHPRQTAVWFDYNNDGLIDLFVGNETIPGSAAEDPCELFRNNGDGTFTECAAEEGIDIKEWVKGVVSADFNNDGRPDLYISVFGGKNHLLRNDGPAGADHSPKAKWRFTDVGEEAGVTEPIKSFPCWFFDYDNDGWPDIFVSGYSIQNAGDICADYLGIPTPAEKPRLYHNNHDGTFTDVTKQTGLWKVLETMGCNFGDLDNDGWLDFYIGTGDPYLGTLTPHRMFRNNGGQSFQEVTTSGDFGQIQKGHAIAFGDLNNDGQQDIYSVVGGAFTGDHYPNQLFANPGHPGHWIKLKLEGVHTNRAALGARIRVIANTPSGERSIYRTVSSGGSFGASPLRQEIGLGDADSIQRVEIYWPVTGRTQTVTGLQLDRAYSVREDEPTPHELHLRSFKWPAASSVPTHHHMMAMPGMN